MTIGNGPEHGLDSGILAGIRWTDKSFPLGRDRQGVSQLPDFDFTELGLLFPSGDTSEKIYILDQMWHTKKLGTALKLHVHFVQTSAALPNFSCDYRYYNNGNAIPGWTTIKTDDGAGPLFTYPGSGSIINLVRFPEIVAPTDEALSAILDLIIARDDTNIIGDVLAKYVDYHFQVDADGSQQEFVK